MPVNPNRYPVREPASEGHRQLYDRVSSVGDLEQRVPNASRNAAQKWLKGSTPRHALRESIQAALGIDYHAWDRAAGVEPPSPPPSASDTDEQLSIGDPSIEEETDSLKMLDHQIRALRSELQCAQGTAKASLYATLNRTIGARAKLEQERLTDEQKLIRSPAWHELRDQIWQVLRKHPDVARELVDALSKWNDTE